MKKSNSLATDSFILIFVRCITMITSIVQTMMLSRFLTKQDYGTYAQGLLIISLASTFLGLGLNNSINYFFNKTNNIEIKKSYTNTIFGLTLSISIIGGFGIVIFKSGIVNYFSNPALSNVLIYVAFRPLCINIISLFQPLYISSGMTKSIALRNFLVSFFQIIITGVALLFTQNISLIFIFLLVLDFAQVLLFRFYFRKNCFEINSFKVNISLIKPILQYTLPLAIALMIGTILKDMDKLLIAKMMTTEDMALYTIVSRPLPFEFISTSFTTVVTPTIINLLNSDKLNQAQEIWADYLEIGYITTWILCIGAIVCAPELLEFLYSQKYADGLLIFIIYIIVEMFRFTYFGLILSAKGLTKWILNYSFITMVTNFILNIILFYYMGIIGPAIATLISIGIINMVQLFHGVQSIGGKLSHILRMNNIAIFLLQLALCGSITYIIKNVIKLYINNNLVILILSYSLFLIVMGLFKYNRLKQLILRMNANNYN